MSSIGYVWVSHYNFIEDIAGGFTLPDRIGIYDRTLRDVSRFQDLFSESLIRYV
jgi:hypothetical protein